MAEKNNTLYVDTPFGKYVKGLTPTTALQMQAVRQQDGALALLLNTKKSDSIKAAEKYSELRYADKEGSLERHITMDLHHQQMIERQHEQEKEKKKQKALPEYVTISSDDEYYFPKKN